MSFLKSIALSLGAIATVASADHASLLQEITPHCTEPAYMKCYDMVHLQFSKCPSDDNGCHCNLLYALTSGCPQQCSTVEHEVIPENTAVTDLCGPNDIKAATLGFGHLLPFFDARGGSRGSGDEYYDYDYEYDYDDEDDDCDNGDDSDDGSQWHQPRPRPDSYGYRPSSRPDNGNYYDRPSAYYPPSEYDDRYGVPPYRGDYPTYPDRNREHEREYPQRINEPEDDEDCDGNGRDRPFEYYNHEFESWSHEEPWTQGESASDYDLIRISSEPEIMIDDSSMEYNEDDKVASVQGIIPGLPRLRKWLRAKKHDIGDFAATEGEDQIVHEDSEHVTSFSPISISMMPTINPTSLSAAAETSIVSTSSNPLPAETNINSLIIDDEPPSLEVLADDMAIESNLKDRIHEKYEQECDEHCQALRSQHGCVAGEGCNFLPNFKEKFQGGTDDQCNEEEGCDNNSNSGNIFQKFPNFNDRFQGCAADDEECLSQDNEEQRLEDLQEKQRQKQLQELQREQFADKQKDFKKGDEIEHGVNQQTPLKDDSILEVPIEDPSETPKEDNPASVEPPKEDNPASVEPPKEDNPASVEPPKEDNPTSVEPPKEDNPTSAEPPKEDNPNQDDQPKEDNPTEEPPKENEPAEPPKQTPIYSEPPKEGTAITTQSPKQENPIESSKPEKPVTSEYPKQEAQSSSPVKDKTITEGPKQQTPTPAPKQQTVTKPKDQTVSQPKQQIASSPKDQTANQTKQQTQSQSKPNSTSATKPNATEPSKQNPAEQPKQAQTKTSSIVNSTLSHSAQLAKIRTAGMKKLSGPKETGSTNDCEGEECDDSNDNPSMPDFSNFKEKIPTWNCAEDDDECETLVRYIGGSNSTNSSSPGIFYNSTTAYAMLGNGSETNNTRFISVNNFDERNVSNSKQNGTINSIVNAKNAHIGTSVSESVSCKVLNMFTIGISFFAVIYWLQ